MRWAAEFGVPYGACASPWHGARGTRGGPALARRTRNLRQAILRRVGGVVCGGARRPVTAGKECTYGG
ncbi:hypothetical protein [Nonomuraea sediminis]|uniref:hypothetical protein n=1 Tax=Nonomuraea sediminis TaxID=2835864 RepID=UPI001BDDAFEF|nr:hypothetical protein [Nonomuraea sediminis]